MGCKLRSLPISEGQVSWVQGQGQAAIRLGWCDKAGGCVFRVRFSTLAPLAKAGPLHHPGGDSGDGGALGREEPAVLGFPDLFFPQFACLAHHGPSIPEVEGLSLLKPWSKS